MRASTKVDPVADRLSGYLDRLSGSNHDCLGRGGDRVLFHIQNHLFFSMFSSAKRCLKKCFER